MPWHRVFGVQQERLGRRVCSPRTSHRRRYGLAPQRPGFWLSSAIALAHQRQETDILHRRAGDHVGDEEGDFQQLCWRRPLWTHGWQELPWIPFALSAVESRGSPLQITRVLAIGAGSTYDVSSDSNANGELFRMLPSYYGLSYPSCTYRIAGGSLPR